MRGFTFLVRRLFYPDILRHGGPAQALQARLLELGSELAVSEGPSPLTEWLSVASKTRTANVLLAANTRRFSVSFWGRGVYLAHGTTPFLKDAARAIDYWVGSIRTARELSAAFRFVTLEPDAEVFERGEEVAAR